VSLPRRTPLARGGQLQRASRPKKRARDTGPSATTRADVWGRAGGRCEVCGNPVAGVLGFSLHHRHPRRMGGSRRPELNSPANLILLCGSGTTGCHGRIEANRERAYEDGLLLHDGATPTDVPVMLADPYSPSQWPRLVWLTDEATYTEEPPE
jgi:hypothetical protein